MTTILIVDDQPDNLYVLERLLRREGLEVLQAGRGEDALHIAASEALDLIILDVMMPGIDGFEVLRRLRDDDATRSIPVILLTANAPDQRLKIQGLNLGADEYLTQPINNNELLARIRGLLRTRQIQQDLQHANAQLRMLLTVIQAGNSTLNLAEAGQRLLDATIKAADMSAGAIWAVSDGEVTLLSHQGLPEDAPGQSTIAKVGGTPLRKLLHAPDVVAGKTADLFPGATTLDEAFGSAVMLPLVYRKNVVGVIQLWARDARQFEAADIEFLHAIADAAATSVQNAQLFEESDRQRKRLAALDSEKDEFISIVAHELKNPLASIKGYAGLLARRARTNAANAATLKGLDVIEQQVGRMTTLLDQLRDVTHIGISRFEIELNVTDLVPLVERVATMLQGTSADHALHLHLAPTPVLAAVDEFRLEQVISNLISNAIKYSPDGGAVEITVDQRISVPYTSTDGATPAAWATITVRDYGMGIPASAKERLFERFYRASNAKGRVSGMGLGLYISREIVQLHGGVLWVESEEGKGSLFGIALPAVAAGKGSNDANGQIPIIRTEANNGAPTVDAESTSSGVALPRD